MQHSFNFNDSNIKSEFSEFFSKQLIYISRAYFNTMIFGSRTKLVAYSGDVDRVFRVMPIT